MLADAAVIRATGARRNKQRGTAPAVRERGYNQSLMEAPWILSVRNVIRESSLNLCREEVRHESGIHKLREKRQGESGDARPIARASTILGLLGPRGPTWATEWFVSSEDGLISASSIAAGCREKVRRGRPRSEFDLHHRVFFELYFASTGD